MSSRSALERLRVLGERLCGQQRTTGVLRRGGFGECAGERLERTNEQGEDVSEERMRWRQLQSAWREASCAWRDQTSVSEERMRWRQVRSAWREATWTQRTMSSRTEFGVRCCAWRERMIEERM